MSQKVFICQLLDRHFMFLQKLSIGLKSWTLSFVIWVEALVYRFDQRLTLLVSATEHIEVSYYCLRSTLQCFYSEPQNNSATAMLHSQN